MSSCSQHLQANTYLAEASGLGRGVYAARPLKEGQIVEVCPVIVVPHGEVDHLNRTSLRDYQYAWGHDQTDVAVALGYGSLYNHSYSPNATFHNDFERATVTITCLQDIKEGQEILVNYNGDPQDQSPLWFDAS